MVNKQYKAMEEKKKEKLTYEQLENVAVQLQQRCAQLQQKLESRDMAVLRMDCLMKIMSMKDSFPKELTDKVISDIDTTLFPPEEKEDTKE